MPLAFDMFSGPNAPVGKAPEWCGWRVRSIDKAISAEHNLSDTEVQCKLQPEMDKAAAVMWAPACETLSRARERPVPGGMNRPRPLRDAANVRGLPQLQSAEAKRVKEANSFCDWTWERVAAGVEEGHAHVIEKPKKNPNKS